MCGIAGQLRFDGREVDSGVIERMALGLLHRGPDDGGTWQDGPVALGSRRLAVIDLSPRAHQPLQSRDGLLTIAFNGEVYNFRELRAALETSGYEFRSDSDTEVVLACYDLYGPAGISRLRGMFAFAIWDGRRRQLMLARDRLGKKPCFYRATPQALWFASEPRVILQDPAVPSVPDTAALHQYLALGYVPGPGSAFAGFQKLPAAHYMIVGEDGRHHLTRYWSPEPEDVQPASHEDAADQLLAHLEEAVRLRLIADVPVGAFLSGGIDSSLIVAVMRRVDAGRVRTFSIGFEHEEYNELSHARRVAAHCETEHREFIVRPDAAAILPRLVWHYSEPFADSSAVPSFYLSQMARADVTVALNGDGGDEVFLGYDRYRAAMLASRMDVMPGWARGAVGAAGRLVPRGGPRTRRDRLRRLLAGVPLDEAARYSRWMAIFNSTQLQQLYTADFAEAVARIDPLASVSGAVSRSQRGSPAERAAQADLETYLPDDLLVKVDIASMARSLELRSPLLDHRVVEFGLGLPLEHKLGGGEQKRVLRTLARRLLPDVIAARPKAGFGVPLDHWFRGELKAYARDMLLDPRSRRRGLFRPEAVERLLSEHATGRAHHHGRIWALLVLEVWFQLFVDGVPPVSPPSLPGGMNGDAAI